MKHLKLYINFLFIFLIFPLKGEEGLYDKKVEVEHPIHEAPIKDEPDHESVEKSFCKKHKKKLAVVGILIFVIPVLSFIVFFGNTEDEDDQGFDKKIAFDNNKDKKEIQDFSLRTNEFLKAIKDYNTSFNWQYWIDQESNQEIKEKIKVIQFLSLNNEYKSSDFRSKLNQIQSIVSK